MMRYALEIAPTTLSYSTHKDIQKSFDDAIHKMTCQSCMVNWTTFKVSVS